MLTRLMLASIIACKFSMYLLLRFTYPFASFLSEELGITVERFLVMLSLGEFMGFCSIFVGSLIDVFGAIKLFAMSHALVIVALILNTALELEISAYISFAFIGIGFYISTPTLQSIVVQLADTASVGQQTSLAESAWALSGLVGFPIMGVIISAGGWRAAFGTVLALVTIATAWVLMRLAPILLSHDAQSPQLHSDVIVKERLNNEKIGDCKSISLRIMRYIRNSWIDRRTRGTLAFTFAHGLGYNILFANIGSWLASEYSLSSDSLGIATFVFGAAELIGSIFCSLLSDRLGLRRSTLHGITSQICSVLIFMAVALSIPSSKSNSWSLIVVLTAIFFVFATMEYVLISALSFISWCANSTEEASLFLSLFFFGESLGRSVGALIATKVQEQWDIEGAIGITGVSMAFAFLTIYSVFPSHQEIMDGRSNQTPDCIASDLGAPSSDLS